MERITGTDTIDLGGGKQGFRGKNPNTGQRGTVVKAQWLNDAQEEICYVIEAAGIPLDPAKRTQLDAAIRKLINNAKTPFASITETKAGTLTNKAVHPQGVAQTIQSGSYLYAAGTGTTSAITASFSPALAAYTPGMVLRVKMPAASTGVSTLNINELGVKPLVLSSGSPIVKGDWVANEILDLIYDGSRFMIIGKSRMTESVYGNSRMATEAETRTGTSKTCVTHPFGVAKAVQSGGYVYAAAAGAANALTANLIPALTEYKPGMVINLQIAANNTGAATLKINSLAALPIQTKSGEPVLAGDLMAGAILPLVCTGTAFQSNIRLQSEYKTVLRADIDLYVRPDGNDNNDGLTNNAAGAFKTIQGAADAALKRYDTAGYSAIIHVADGTYGAVNIVRAISTTLEIVGNIAAPDKVVIDGGQKDAVAARDGTMLKIRGFLLRSSGSSGLLAYNRSKIDYEAINFGYCQVAHIYSNSLSQITATGNYSISNNATYHVLALAFGVTTLSGRTVTILSNSFFSSAFIQSNQGGVWVSGMTFTNAGWVSGSRYLATALGLIYTAGGGANYLPGSSAGASTGGGIYV